MANREWDNANVDKKLEMLRTDIGDIAAKVNQIAWDLITVRQQVADLVKNHQTTAKAS